MRLRGVFQVGLVIAAGALAVGCTSTVDRQAAPLGSPGSTAPAPSATTGPSGPAAPTATSVPGTEMTPPVDRNVCGRVRTATTDYSRAYDNAAQADKATAGKKWSGFIRERAKEASEAKLQADLRKLADEVDSWRPGQPDLRAYTSLLNTACARFAA